MFNNWPLTELVRASTIAWVFFKTLEDLLLLLLLLLARLIIIIISTVSLVEKTQIG